MKREFRFAGRELRASKDKPQIEGYAAVFNAPSDELMGFREVVKPGAFTRSLNAGADVRCLINHDPNLVVGRSKSGTLRLSEDSRGLRFECDMPDTQAGRDLLESVRRGDMDQCSFGFVCVEDGWQSDKGQRTRELRDVELLDVSVVTYPAYPATSVGERAAGGYEMRMWPDGLPESIEKRADEAPTKTVGGKTLHASLQCFVDQAKVLMADLQAAIDEAEKEVSEPDDGEEERERLQLQAEIAARL